jgi:hypothetical protein
MPGLSAEPAALAHRLRALAPALLALLLLVSPALRPLPAHAQGVPAGVLAPGNPPLTRQVTDALAETIVFVLQVVATGDTWDLEGADEASFKDAMAQGLAAAYSGMEPAAQQAMAQLPQLRTALREAWPGLAEAERDALRAELRPGVEAMLVGVDCQTFIGLAEADLVEDTLDNVARLLDCWNEEIAQPAPPGQHPAAQPSQPSQPSQPNPVAQQAQQNEAYRRAQQGLMDSHNTYVSMTNMLTQNHAANMNAILTMGGSPYRYEVKYR